MLLYDFSVPGPKARYAVLTVVCIVFVSAVFIVWEGVVGAEIARIRAVLLAVETGSGQGRAVEAEVARLELLLANGAILTISALLASAAAAWFQWRVIRISRRERAAAKRDHHTGLYTRQVFMRAVRYGFSPGRKHGQAFDILALVSIDDFAGLVEAHGITVADNAAIAVAHVLKRLHLADAILCRFGESAFAIAMPGGADGRARAVLATICDEVRADFTRTPHAAGIVTVSVGLSSRPEVTAEGRLQAAIVLNARAQAEGGNRMRADGSETAAGDSGRAAETRATA